MAFDAFDDMPIKWTDHEDIAMKLYDKFGDEFTESKIYRIRFNLGHYIKSFSIFANRVYKYLVNHLNIMQYTQDHC